MSFRFDTIISVLGLWCDLGRHWQEHVVEILIMMVIPSCPVSLVLRPACLVVSEEGLHIRRYTTLGNAPIGGGLVEL